MNPKIRMRCTMIDIDVDTKNSSGTVRLERLDPDMTIDLVGINVSAFKVGTEYDIQVAVTPVALLAAPSEKSLITLAKAAATKGPPAKGPPVTE